MGNTDPNVVLFAIAFWGGLVGAFYCLFLILATLLGIVDYEQAKGYSIFGVSLIFAGIVGCGLAVKYQDK